MERLRQVLDAEPQRARDIAPNGSTTLWRLPNDEAVALEVVELLLAHGADPSVRMKDGTDAADSARALGMERVAMRLESATRGDR